MVPENTPSILRTLSPVRTRSLSVEMIGKPAPTVDSFRNRAPVDLLAFKIASYREYEPEKAFLLGVMTWSPEESQSG